MCCIYSQGHYQQYALLSFWKAIFDSSIQAATIYLFIVCELSKSSDWLIKLLNSQVRHHKTQFINIHWTDHRLRAIIMLIPNENELLDCINSTIFHTNCFWLAFLKTYFINLQWSQKITGLCWNTVHIHLIAQNPVFRMLHWNPYVSLTSIISFTIPNTIKTIYNCNYLSGIPSNIMISSEASTSRSYKKPLLAYRQQQRRINHFCYSNHCTAITIVTWEE